MPLYDFKCEDCNKEFEDFLLILQLKDYILSTRCICGGRVKQIITGVGRDWFHPHVNYDFDGTPRTVTSKKHLKKLCKEFGVYARCLD